MPEEDKQDSKDLKEQIGKHLRAADELTRQQKFEEALREIERALEIDPKHNYARSFLERVKLMYKRSQPKDSEPAVTEEKPPEDPAAIISEYLAKAEEFIKNKDYTHALEEVAKVYKVDPKNYYAQTFSERIEILMNEKGNEEIKPVATLVQPELPEPQIQDKPETSSRMMYMELLKEVWFDGKITEQEAQELKTIRDLFGITHEEHLKLERETRIGAYLEALRIAWRDHSLSGLEQKALQMMIDKYGISKDEQIEAESRYADIQKASKSRGTILVVDSDRNILVSLSKQLGQRGLTVLLSQKVEDALQILRTHTPNLIISEILFPKDHIDGMGFRNKLSEDPALGRTPFIFISSIAHKKVVQACYRLGVDHVLEKPVDMKILFSIIDGKLRNSPQEK